MTHPWSHWDGEDLILRLHIQPRAKRDEIAGPHGERLKVRIKAPPVDGKANQYLLGFLARQFRVPRACVTLETGASGREKRIRIHQPVIPPELLHLFAGS